MGQVCDISFRRPRCVEAGAYAQWMPRRLRSFAEGIYHVGSHGSDERDLFLNDEDHNDFLDRLAAVWRRCSSS